jgi:hypothetical protein
MTNETKSPLKFRLEFVIDSKYDFNPLIGKVKEFMLSIGQNPRDVWVTVILNPQPHEIWDAQDGGSFYVVGRTPRMVQVQRRPFGDSKAEPYWIRVATFAREVTGRIS